MSERITVPSSEHSDTHREVEESGDAGVAVVTVEDLRREIEQKFAEAIQDVLRFFRERGADEGQLDTIRKKYIENRVRERMLEGQKENETHEERRESKNER